MVKKDGQGERERATPETSSAGDRGETIETIRRRLGDDRRPLSDWVTPEAALIGTVVNCSGQSPSEQESRATDGFDLIDFVSDNLPMKWFPFFLREVGIR